MRFQDALLLAFRAVLAQRLRSFLTLLGIAVGIASVILLTSIGEGIHRFVLGEFSQFGTNNITVVAGKTRTGGAPSGLPSSARALTLEDAKSLEHQPHVLAVTPNIRGNAEVEGNGRTRRALIYGVNAKSQLVFRSTVKSGQFLPADDENSARAFVVLGSKLKEELFGGESPLGQRLRIGGLHFRIIGVMEPKGQFLGIDLDDTAFIPAARGQELFNREGVDEINLAVAEGIPAASVAERIKARLIERHGREDFTLVTQEDMLKTLSNILNVLTLAVGALGGISLLVGGVGIVTIMTIAVSERTGEIGLLVALGAPRRTILLLFLGEAVALSALGGGLGLIIGFGLAQLLHLLLPALPVHTPLVFVLLAEVLAIAIGLAAGVLPARRAARLDPVEALRNE